MPKKSRLKTNVGVNADTVARYKYVSRGGKVDGFYSGNTFANQMGISTQVPNKVEIVSNNMAAKVREVPIETRFVKVFFCVFIIKIFLRIHNKDTCLDFGCQSYKRLEKKLSPAFYSLNRLTISNRGHNNKKRAIYLANMVLYADKRVFDYTKVSR